MSATSLTARNVQGETPPEPALDPSDVPASRPLTLVGLELSLETAGLNALDQAQRAFGPPEFAEMFRSLAGTEEAAVLRTCHRLELLLVLRSPEGRGTWLRALPGRSSSWRVREGREVVRHLFRVTSGRESIAWGEREVRDQVREARGTVLSRHPRPILRGLFQQAIEAAPDATDPARPEPSIASLAVVRLLSLVRPPSARVLVVGGGTVGRQVVRLLAPHIQVVLGYRNRPPDPEFLRQTGCRAVGLDGLRGELTSSDAVVTAAKAGSWFLRPTDLPSDREFVVVDLGVPRNVDPSVRANPRVTLVDLEDLRAKNPPPSEEPRAQIDLERRADCAYEEAELRLLEPAVNALRRAAESARALEVARARPFLGDLRPDQEEALERLTRNVVDRILRAPTQRLRGLPSGPEGERLRRLALELLRPDGPGE